MPNYITLSFGLLLLLSTPCIAQDHPEDWEHFPIIGELVDALETETAIWFAHRYQLLRWDKTQQTLSYNNEAFPYSQLNNTRDLFARDGQYYLLTSHRLYQLQDGLWQVIWNGTLASQALPDDVSKIVGTQGSELLLQSENGIIYTCSPEQQTYQLEQSPWNINWWPSRSFAQTADGSMWAWSPRRLVRWQGEETTTFPVPFPEDSIVAAVPGADHFRWVISDRHLSFYQEQWINVPLAALSNQSLTTHQVLDEQSICLVFGDKILTVRFTDGSYELVEKHDQLGNKQPGHQLYLADDGHLWFMDALLRQYHYLTPDHRLHSVAEHHWLPTNELVSTHVTRDRDGHIWVCTPDQTVFYAGEKWHVGEEVYPGFPRAVAQLQFTTNGSPIAFSPEVPSKNRAASLQQYHQGQWVSYPLPDAGFGLSPADARQLLLDREDNIWLFSPGSTIVYTWDRNEWISISTTDLLSRPASFTSIAFDQDNHVLLGTPTGIIKHDRQTAAFTTFSGLGIVPALFFHSLSIDTQNNIWYGGRELYQWSPGSTAQVIDLPLWEILYGFLSIYHFAENETWIVFKGSENEGIMAPNTNGELVKAAPNYHTTGYGDIIEQDNKGRIWVLDVMGIRRFTRPSSNAAISASTEGQLHAFPNPSCCHVQLSWKSTDISRAELKLYNAQGQHLLDILRQEGYLGPQQVVVPRRGLPAGVYFAVLRQGERVETVKLIFK